MTCLGQPTRAFTVCFYHPYLKDLSPFYSEIQVKAVMGRALQYQPLSFVVLLLSTVGSPFDFPSLITLYLLDFCIRSFCYTDLLLASHLVHSLCPAYSGLSPLSSSFFLLRPSQTLSHCLFRGPTAHQVMNWYHLLYGIVVWDFKSVTVSR